MPLAPTEQPDYDSFLNFVVRLVRSLYAVLRCVNIRVVTGLTFGLLAAVV